MRSATTAAILGTSAFYRAALECLRFIEARRPTGRRFGAEADARWNRFHGDLTTSDRIDLLLRDADAEWPAAFAARAVFGLRAVAEDEPFGAEWEPLDPVLAEELWRGLQQQAAPASVAEALSACAAAWELVPAALPEVAIGSIGPADRLLVVGPGAITAVATRFAQGRDLDWAAQVLCVATPPAHRQLAAVAAALLGSTKATPLWRPGPAPDTTAATTAAGDTTAAPADPGARRLIRSDDADPADLDAARTIGAITTEGGPHGAR